MGVFRLAPEALAGKDPEALELDLIDHGLEEMGEGTERQGRAADDHPRRVRRLRQAAGGHRGARHRRPVRGIRVRRPEPRVLDEDKAKEVLELVDALEQDEDVQRVFHNLS